MTRAKLIKALDRVVNVVPGRQVCLGCGYEHRCAHNGCAIIRAAIAEMKKIPAVHGRLIDADEVSDFGLIKLNVTGFSFQPLESVDNAKGMIEFRRWSDVPTVLEAEPPEENEA